MSTRPTGAHPTPEEVDALLDPTGWDPSVAEHVSSCATCTVVRAALEEVRSLLQAEALRVPEPPADLDTRIAAALAGAVLSDDTAVSDEAAAAKERAQVGADVVPLDSRRRRMPRWLAVAAGVAVIGGVGLTTAQLVGSGLSQSEDATAGAALDEDAGAEGAAPEVAGPRDGSLHAVATGTDYDPLTLTDQVDDLVVAVQSGNAPDAPATLDAFQNAPTAANGEESDASGDRARLTTPAGIAGCLDAVGAGEETPVAVDLATYEGDPVAVIVLRSTGGGLDVWVVSPTCAPGDEGLRQFSHIDP